MRSGKNGSRVPSRVADSGTRTASATDPWGFYVDETPWAQLPRSQRLMRASLKLDEERDRKWTKMASDHGDIRTYLDRGRHRAKLLNRIRKGVPNKWRAAVWPQLVALDVKPKKAPAGRSISQEKSLRTDVTYVTLCRQTAGTAEENPLLEVIERDLCRTFPRHELFDSKVEDGGGAVRDEEKMGVTQLRRILRAYAAFDAECGYCQGMNYVTALLIIHMNGEIGSNDPTGAMRRPSRSMSLPSKATAFESLEGSAEEEVFWFLTSLANAPRTHLRELWLPGMTGCRKALFIFDTLLRQHAKAAHAHMLSENIHPSMYATHWIVTLFSAQFPFALVTRVWDTIFFSSVCFHLEFLCPRDPTFLAEGWKAVYRVAIALIATHEKEVLSKDFEKLMIWLRELPETVDVARVLAKAGKLGLTTDDVKKAEAKWDPDHPPV